MAIVFRVRDGENGDRTDQGMSVSSMELTRKLSARSCRYLGKSPPRFYADHPTDYFRHVVIEIVDSDALNDMFGRVGFYYGCCWPRQIMRKQLF